MYRNSVARAKAKQRGLLRYKNGKPCIHGHLSERLTSNGSCMECARLSRAKYYGSAAGKLTAKRSRQKHHAQRMKDQKKWRDANPKYQAKYCAFKNRTDIQFKLAKILRSRLRKALQNHIKPPGKKSTSAVSALGCPIDQLVGYIASQFHDGMKWSNWGTYWHLDHIKPLISFNLTNRKQLREACHYTNLQPLLISEHREKSGMERRLNQ